MCKYWEGRDATQEVVKEWLQSTHPDWDEDRSDREAQHSPQDRVLSWVGDGDPLNTEEVVEALRQARLADGAPPHTDAQREAGVHSSGDGRMIYAKESLHG